jgi:hypothetical protein
MALGSGARAPATQSLYVAGIANLFSPDEGSWLTLNQLGYLEVHTTAATNVPNIDRATGTSKTTLVWSASLGKELNARADAYLEMTVSTLVDVGARMQCLNLHNGMCSSCRT